MSAEYRSYNPVNFTPDHFLNPPTSKVWPEIAYLNKHLKNAIEGTWRIDKNNLLVGTEFEVIYFDSNSDPCEMWRKYRSSKENPNYSHSHLNKVNQITQAADKLAEQYPDEFFDCDDIGTLMIEYRTAPQSVDCHASTINRFAEIIRKEAKKLHVLPVIYSQHIHLTINRKSFVLRTNYLDKNQKVKLQSKDFQDNVITASFSRLLPFVVLPEEYDRKILSSPAERSYSSKIFEHPEFRVLSSEYANDPLLNLCLCLRAMYASIFNPEFVTAKEHNKNTYIEEAGGMINDKELVDFFGMSTLSTLVRIVEQYPAVSRRDITIDEVVAVDIHKPKPAPAAMLEADL